MSTIGIWNLGSDAYDQTTNSIKSTLADHLPLENLSIHTSGRRALQKRLAKDTPFGDVLKSATQIYLAQYSCVIFVIDGKMSPKSLNQGRTTGTEFANQPD